VQCPIQSDVDDGAWLDPQNIAEFAIAAESAGFDAIAFTDHPAPSHKWLNAGGHETFDPFVGLAFCAAVTTEIKLMTYLAVLPYRNPLLAARSMASLDVLSGGRSIFVVGTGYLRSEFAALGADFETRNEVFDESIEAICGSWSTDNFTMQGAGFKATGQTLRPGVVQRPHPPLWVGGNSGRTLERVAAWAQGWAPLVGSAQLTTTSRTAALTTLDELRPKLAHLGELLQANGRELADIDICVAGLMIGSGGHSDGELLESLSARIAAGVTWSGVNVGRETSYAEALHELRRFGELIRSQRVTD
jgi:probable F420-dependent oxidoreductase